MVTSICSTISLEQKNMCNLEDPENQREKVAAMTQTLLCIETIFGVKMVSSQRLMSLLSILTPNIDRPQFSIVMQVPKQSQYMDVVL